MTDFSETYNYDYKLKSENLFETNVIHLRGHSKKLAKPQPNLDHNNIIIFFRAKGAVEHLVKPEEVVCAQTLSSFRTNYIESRTDRSKKRTCYESGRSGSSLTWWRHLTNNG